MKKLLTLICVGSLLFLFGCATPYPRGLLVTDMVSPIHATNSTDSSKVGKACVTTYLSLVAKGDSSIETAKKNGNITEVSSISYSVDSVLGIVGTYCTIVTGK